MNVLPTECEEATLMTSCQRYLSCVAEISTKFSMLTTLGDCLKAPVLLFKLVINKTKLTKTVLVWLFTIASGLVEIINSYTKKWLFSGSTRCFHTLLIHNSLSCPHLLYLLVSGVTVMIAAAVNPLYCSLCLQADLYCVQSQSSQEGSWAPPCWVPLPIMTPHQLSRVVVQADTFPLKKAI